MDKNFRLIPLFIVTFLDMLGIGLVLPILPLILLETDILAAGTPFSVRTFLLGFLIAAYPLSQFLGAPVLGVLSDRFGRKKLLIVSILGTVVGYALFALGLVIHSLPLLFVGRILDGLTGGNISIVRSAIADVSTPHEKMKNFGFIGMAFGFGFIIGPFLGAKLSDSSLVPWFSFSTPFWFAAILSAVNLLFIIFLFRETLKARIRHKITFWIATEHIKKAFTLKEFRMLFLSLFLVMFGWSFFTQFFQVFLHQKFSYTIGQIGTFYMYIGILSALAQGFVVRHVSARYGTERAVGVSLIILSFAFIIYTLLPVPWMMYPLHMFVALSSSFMWPGFSTIISNRADETMQGEVMGIQQSVISLSQSIPPLIAGIVVAFNINYPVLLASLCVFLGWGVFMAKGRRNTS